MHRSDVVVGLSDREMCSVLQMKIHLFDELLKGGFIKKYEPTPEETRYELRALGWYE